MGCSTDTINTFFQPVESTIIINLRSNTLYKSKAYLHQKYIVEGLSCQQIADNAGCARTSVLKFLKEFGFETKKPGSNLNRKRGLAYGQYSGERNHKRELENIKKMRELRGKGFSYEKIASVFNSMKIPTKTRRGKWHRKTVQSILGRNSFTESP